MKIVRVALALGLMLPAVAAAQGSAPRALPAPGAPVRLCAAPIGTSCQPLAAPACTGHGQPAGGACSCTPGWTGPTCGIPASVGADCNGHGDMVAGRCVCSTFWMGADCGTAGLSLTGRFVRE